MSTCIPHSSNTKPLVKSEPLSDSRQIDASRSTESMEREREEHYDACEELAAAYEEFQDQINDHIARFSTRYNPRNERLPLLAAYHPSFKKVEDHCTELMKDAAALLQDSDYKDRRTAQLLEQAMASQTPKYSLPRKIGLIGDSGVGMSDSQPEHLSCYLVLKGKSSLINSLLDTPDIALSVSSFPPNIHCLFPLLVLSYSREQ